MAWMKLSSLLLFILIAQSVTEDIRSLKMSIMVGWQLQCADTTCISFAIITKSSVRACQIACLAQVQCEAANFEQSNSNCELFTNLGNQNSNILAQTGTVTMTVKAGTRIPPEPTTTSTTTSSSTSTTTTTSSTSTATTPTTTTSKTTSTTSTTTSITATSVTSAATAPTNLVSYRGNNGQTYTFSVTGSCSGGIWGTTIYTDDSNLATAAVHAGFSQCNVMNTITVQILAGQSSYTASTQNGITSNTYGSWPGSYTIISGTG